MESFSDLFDKVQELDEFWTEELVAEFTEELVRCMDAKGISRSQLASLLGARPSYVTKILKGNVNFTFATVTKLSRLLGVRPRLHLAPRGSRTLWYDVMDGDTAPATVGDLEVVAPEEPKGSSRKRQKDAP
jgi:ribosome-binding protein aMBF1 (putative translation factor)